MQRVTVIDPQTAGISGDMLLGAIIDAGADPKTVQRILDQIPQHYSKCKKIELNVSTVKKHGFRACKVDLAIIESEGEAHADEFLRAAEKIAEASRISRKASTFAVNSIRDLVMVESKLHGSSLEETHLHEAGSVDTLADIFGVAVACDTLGIFESEIYSTPVAVGGGTVSFSHGKLGTPAPAVLEIARQKHISIRGGPENVELTTPTGISMLANLAVKFVETYPPMTPEIIGHGAGKRELQDSPNILRLVIGNSLTGRMDTDSVQVLETNLDDVNAEILGHTLQQVVDAGAKDAWITPAQFKKNRPGHVLHVICDIGDAEKLAELVMKETGTLGVRYQQWNRFILQREIKEVKVLIQGKEFSVRVKFARDRSGKVLNVKPEFDDIQDVAREVSLPAREVSEIVLREISER